MEICFTTPISPKPCIPTSQSYPFQSTCTRRRRVCSRANPPGPKPTDKNSAVVKSSRKYDSVSWGEVEVMCDDIATQARAEKFDVILAVTRGGLVPATLLSETFEVRNVLSATVIFYTDDGDQFFGMTEPRFLSFPSGGELNDRKVLIVDDVWDSGRTAHAVKRRVERAAPKDVKVAVLHYKPEMNIFPGDEPDFYSKITSDWMLYPWERASPRAPQIAPGNASVGKEVSSSGMNQVEKKNSTSSDTSASTSSKNSDPTMQHESIVQSEKI